jgi:hypothetical protein
VKHNIKITIYQIQFDRDKFNLLSDKESYGKLTPEEKIELDKIKPIFNQYFAELEPDIKLPKEWYSEVGSLELISTDKEKDLLDPKRIAAGTYAHINSRYPLRNFRGNMINRSDIMSVKIDGKTTWWFLQTLDWNEIKLKDGLFFLMK